MKPPLSIIAVDDHHLFLKGITEFFRESPLIKSVRTCSNYESLMQEIKREIPDIVFIDLNIRPHSGFPICEEIKRMYPTVFIAILTAYDDLPLVQKAKKCGADAYFIKETDPEIFTYFFESLINEDVKGFFAHVPLRPNSDTAFNRDSFKLLELLTRREREIIKMIVNGVSHSEIESSLGITNATFKKHKANIMGKLKMQNDIKLGIFAVQYGLLANGSII